MKVDQYRFLREVALFEQLRDEELAEVAGMFRERTYRKNDIIFFEEDTGNYMYIVKDGRVKVSRLLPNGKEMILAFRETGEYFGEMSLLDGGTSAATVTAVIPATILFTTFPETPEQCFHPTPLYCACCAHDVAKPGARSRF